MMEENIFKSCLKRKVKFTASTFIKFLITGTVAFSLTACGGGGGGGSSSSSGGNNAIIKFPGVDNIIAQENIQNETNKIFDTDISSTNSKIGYTGLKVSNNSNVIFKQGRNIDISGKGAVTGILVSGNSKVTNEGNIKIAVDYIQDDNSIQDDTFNTLIKYMSKGIFVTDRSTGINNGVIEIKGSATGILSYGAGSTGINKGIIKITGNGSTWKEAPTIGMASFYGGKVVNENSITGSVYGQMGMFSCQGELVNNGMIQLSENDSYGMVIQKGIAENGENGKIILSHGTGRDPEHHYSVTNEGIEVESGKGINKGLIEITNKYSYDYPDNTDFDYLADVGMYGGEGAELINEATGKINISGSVAGMMIDGQYGGKNVAINKGIINIVSEKTALNYENVVESVGMFLEDGGKIENNNLITGNGGAVTGMECFINVDENNKPLALPEDNIVTNNGKIELSGMDIYGIEGIGNITNNGSITLIGKNEGELDSQISYIAGIDVEESNVLNNGKIEIQGYRIIGINGYNSQITNNKLIKLNGKFGTGILNSFGGKVENKGQIELTGIDMEGINVSVGSFASNYGTITVNGENSFGMTAEKGGVVINESSGVINVNGAGSYGIKASGQGSRAENYGTINVGNIAAGGMIAENGGYIYNKGSINIDKSHSFANENEAEKFAMQVDGNSTMKNDGKINTNATVEIGTSGTYIIGTNEDGSYGKLSAKNAKFEGETIVESNVARGNYKKEHILENVVEAENIILGENVNFKSDSLLYNASVEKDVFGNLDAKLTRNDKNISDFTDKKFIEASSIFDSYINNEDEYNKLSLKEKEVVDTIFDKATSESSLRNAVNKIVGTEHLNTQKQIFDIKNNFKKYDNSILSTLDIYDFNFQFVGEYSDTSSKNGIIGYENKMTGFDGAIKLSDNFYGVLGYGYSDIDYDGESDGKIQTIHTGIYKDLFINEYKLRMGMYGEYNFHKNNRAIFDKKAESEFNSYLVGASGEISKKYGKDLYVKPLLSLDVTYGNIESFDEEKADGFNLNIDKQNYTSVLPKVEIILGKDFENLKLFTSAEYSYEIGDMDKDMTIELLNKKADIKNNEMEHGQFNISAGGSVNINNLSLSTEIGKDFGKRDREYIKAGFSYKF